MEGCLRADFIRASNVNTEKNGIERDRTRTNASLPDHGTFKLDGLMLRIHELLQPALWSEKVLHQLTGEPSEGIAMQTNQSVGDVCGNGHGHEVFARLDRIDQWNDNYFGLLVISYESGTVDESPARAIRTYPT